MQRRDGVANSITRDRAHALTMPPARTGRNLKWWLLPSAGMIAGMLALVPAAAADLPEICNTSFDPYTASEALKDSCGIKTFPLRRKVEESDGSTYYEWLVEGDRVTSTVPPPDWNAAKATVEERQRYGIVPAAPPSDPKERAAWKRVMETLKIKPPADDMIETSVPKNYHTQQFAGVQNYPSSRATETVISYAQPSINASCGSSYGTLWGGFGSNPLVQNGSNLDWPQEPRYAAWWEIYPDTLSMPIPFYATPGQGFKAQVDKITSGGNHYHFQWYNADASRNGGYNAPAPVDIYTSRYDGSSAAFIVERPSGLNLENFGQWHPTTATVNGWAANTGAHDELDMYGTGTGKNLAPLAQMIGYDNGGNGGFTVQWEKCL